MLLCQITASSMSQNKSVNDQIVAEKHQQDSVCKKGTLLIQGEIRQIGLAAGHIPG